MEAPPAWANPQQQPVQQQQQQQQVLNNNVNTQQTILQQHENELFAKYSTLNEPVIDTIMRDVYAVTTKLQLICSQQPFPYMNQRISSTTSTTTASDTATANGSTVPVAATTTTTDYTHIYWNALSPVYNYSRVATNDTGNSNNAATPSPTTTTTGTDDTTTTTNHIITLSDEDRHIIKQLKDWDLWGPLFICLILAIVLSMNAPSNKNQAAVIFATVFTSISIGSSIITFNVQLLNGTISFFQSICVLGYSIFPLMIAAIIIGVCKLFYISWIWIHCIIVIIGGIWSLRISSIFISLYIPIERRALALYPLLFYYTFLAWLIVLF